MCFFFIHLHIPTGSKETPQMAYFVGPFKESFSGQQEAPGWIWTRDSKASGSEGSKQ